MSWQEFNAATLFPGATQEILEAAGDTADTVADTADTLASAIELLADLITDVADPQRAIVQQLIETLRNLLTDVMNTGIYLYYDASTFPWYQLRSTTADDLVRAMDIDETESDRRAAWQEEYDTAIARGDTPPDPYEPPRLPLTAGRTYGYNGWKQRWADSFYDHPDVQRPAFSPDAQISAMVFMAGTPSFDAIPAILRALGELFGIKPFLEVLDRLAITRLAEDAKKGEKSVVVEDPKWFREDDLIWIRPEGVSFDSHDSQFVDVKTVHRQTNLFALYDALANDFPKGTLVAGAGNFPRPRGASTAPDWRSRYYLGSRQPTNPLAVQDEDGLWYIPFRLGDLPPMKQVEKLVKKLIGLLEVADGILQMIQEMAEVLREKAEQLRRVAQLIADAIELIALILALTGVYVIKIESSDGPAGLIAALENAGPPPLPDRSFVVGVCLLAGTADLGPISELFGV